MTRWRLLIVSLVLVAWMGAAAASWAQPSASDLLKAATAERKDQYRRGNPEFEKLCERAGRDPELMARLAMVAGDAREDFTPRVLAIEALGRVGPTARAVALADLRKAVEDQNAGLKLEAAMALLRVGSADEEAVAALHELAKTDDRSARFEIFHGISAIGPPAKAAVGFLMHEAANESGWDRPEAINAIAAIGEAGAQAKPLLLRLMKENDARVSVAATRALPRIAPDAPDVTSALLAGVRRWGPAGWAAADELIPRRAAVAPRLIEMLDVGDVGTRRNVLHALRFFGDAAAPAAERLGAMAISTSTVDDDDMRRAAIAGLANLGERGVHPLIGVLESRQARGLRMQAIEALTAIGPEAGTAAPALARLLRDRGASEDERLAAIEALGRIGPAAAAESVADLIRIVRDGKEGVMREAAIDALGRMGPAARAAVEPLERVIQDARSSGKYGPLARRAAEALGRLGASPLTAVPLLRDMLSADAQSAAAAADALGRFGRQASDTLPALRRLIGSGNPALRIAAALAVARIDPGDREAMTALVRSVKSPTAKVPQFELGGAIEALGEIGPAAETALPTLRAVMEARGVPAAKAALAVWRIGGRNENAIAALIRLVGSDDAMERGVACEVLPEIGPGAREAIPLLWRMVYERRDDRERDAAIRAIRAIERGPR